MEVKDLQALKEIEAEIESRGFDVESFIMEREKKELHAPRLVVTVRFYQDYLSGIREQVSSFLLDGG